MRRWASASKAAQVEQVAQDGDAAARLKEGEGIQRGQHRGGTGAEAVVQDQAAVHARQRVEPSGQRFDARQRGQGLVQGHAQRQAHGHGSQGGIDVVLAQQRQPAPQLAPAPQAGHGEKVLDKDGEGDSLGTGYDRPGHQVGVGVQAVGDDPRPRPPGHGPHAGVVVVEDGHPTLLGRGQGLHQAALFGGDGLQRAQVGQVGLVDRRHHANSGPGQRRQVADLVHAVAGHFQHGDLVLGSQAAQGDGQAVAVVVVAIVAKDGVALRQDGGSQLFGGRLAAGAGDAHHPGAELAQDVARPVEESLAAVVHHQAGDAVGFQVKGPLAEHARCPVAGRLQDIVVAVALVGDDGQEQLSSIQRAGVVAEIGKGFGKDRPVNRAAGCCQQVRQMDQSSLRLQGDVLDGGHLGHGRRHLGPVNLGHGRRFGHGDHGRPTGSGTQVLHVHLGHGQGLGKLGIDFVSGDHHRLGDDRRLHIDRLCPPRSGPPRHA